MTPISWRQAHTDDADALAQLGAATFLETFAFDHPGKQLVAHLKSEHTADYYAAKLADDQVDILIGETPLGAPVGYLMMVSAEHSGLQDVGDIELKRIYLLGPWQGGGNGTDLMSRALDIAKKRQAKRILLSVYEKNHKAVAFYERAGFTQIGETVFMVGDIAFRDMVYAKSL